MGMQRSHRMESTDEYGRMGNSGSSWDDVHRPDPLDEEYEEHCDWCGREAVHVQVLYVYGPRPGDFTAVDACEVCIEAVDLKNAHWEEFAALDAVGMGKRGYRPAGGVEGYRKGGYKPRETT